MLSWLDTIVMLYIYGKLYECPVSSPNPLEPTWTWACVTASF